MAGLSARSSEDRAAGGWRLCAAEPAAALSSQELISLACQVVQGTRHPMTAALRAALDDSADLPSPSSPLETAAPASRIAPARRTINGFEVLLEDAQEAGPIIPPQLYASLLRVTDPGWRFLVLLACRESNRGESDRCQSERGEQQRSTPSCLGVLSFEPLPDRQQQLQQPIAEPPPPAEPSRRPVPPSPRARMRPPVRRGWWRARYLVITVAIGVYLLAGRTAVPPGNTARVTRLGQIAAWLPAGVHWRGLWPLEQVRTVDTARIRMVQLGSNGQDVPNSEAPTDADNRLPAPTLVVLTTFADAGPLASADLPASRTTGANIIPVPIRIGGSIFYTVADPQAYLAAIDDPHSYVRLQGEAVLADLIGRRSLQDCMQPNRLELAQLCQHQLQERLDRRGCGIQIAGVRITRIEGDDPHRIWLQAYEPHRTVTQRIEQIIQQGQQERSRLRADTKEAVNHLLMTAEAERQRQLDAAEDQRAELEAMAEVCEPAALLHLLRTALANTQKVLIDPAIDNPLILPPASPTTQPVPSTILPQTSTNPAGKVAQP